MLCSSSFPPVLVRPVTHGNTPWAPCLVQHVSVPARSSRVSCSARVAFLQPHVQRPRILVFLSLPTFPTFPLARCSHDTLQTPQHKHMPAHLRPLSCSALWKTLLLCLSLPVEPGSFKTSTSILSAPCRWHAYLDAHAEHVALLVLFDAFPADLCSTHMSSSYNMMRWPLAPRRSTNAGALSH